MEHEIKQTTTPQIKWGPTVAIFGTITAYLFSQLILIIPIALLALTTSYSKIQNEIENSAWLGLVLTGISSLGMFFVIWLLLKTKRAKFVDLGFRRPVLKDFGWLIVGIVTYFFILMIALAIASLIPGFNANEIQDIGYKNAEGWQIGLAFIGLVVIPPLAEEMVFRGFLYRGLSSKWKKLTAALFSSLLFALVHFQWNVGVDVFVLSMILVFVYEKTKNLWVCVGLHAIKNFIAFLAIFVFVGR